ncbi:MAG: Rieske 2Fe-2S domain-containing protein [Gammaproteobacteria bacterium]|nr:Rieske 2Fe-2S domain-containing protein [Gammaproteobacteria bacterium]
MTANNTVRLPTGDAGTPLRDIRKTGLDPDFWYPIAHSREVKPGKAHAAAFAGQAIVLVRGKEGRVFALEDRCAHRQVPLHVGEVVGDGIKCGYHGWTYDSTGRCVSVPYLDQCASKPNSVKAYPCREAYGLVFVFPGDSAKANEVAFPEVPSANDPAYKTRYLNRRVNCHYSFMHENLMDMNHQFLHRRLMGGIKTIFLGVRSGPNWIETDYTFKRNAGKQPLGEKFMLGKRPEAQEGERDLMTIRTGYPYQTLRFWTGGSTHPALDLWNCYIPLDRAQRSNHTYGLMMIRRPSIPGLINLLWPAIVWFTNGIFAEDRFICELEQAAFDAQGEDQNQEIFPAIRGLRRVLVENGIPLEA